MLATLWSSPALSARELVVTGAARALIAFMAFLALWWVGVRVLSVPSFLLPAPDAVLARLVFLARAADLTGHALVTLSEIATGFVLGAVAGCSAGMMFARRPVAERVASPFILLIQTAPKIAIAPLLILWFGLGPGPKVVLVAIVTFFPVLAGAIAGTRLAPRGYGDLAQVLGLTSFQRAMRIDLPLALPPILGGLRIATTQAVTAAVVGELMGADKGLGYLLSAAQESSDAAAVLGIVLLLSLIGWAFHELVRAAESSLLAWRA
jgi:NitT/TauT family transport system permease protein